ncbi:MAG: hypothetical protein ACLFWM_08695 [Actinomycetota bacterium]
MRIVAAFAYRYEPDWLVDQLRENLSWVDGFAELDTRGRDDVWMPRVERVRAVQAIARDQGADWVLALDPDERLEDGAETALRALAEMEHGRYSLRMRELWTPSEYRVDGVWGQKWRKRFYRLGNRDEPRRVDLNIYHLKMIEPANRRERVRIHSAHNHWDNRGRGFDYMLDEEGIVTETIPEGRGFTPPYRPYEFSVSP